MRARRFDGGWIDRRGVATVEFAVIAPVMILIVLGTIEMCNVFRVQAKVNTLAGQLATLVATEASVTAPAGSLADVCKGAMFNLSPYASSSATADIVSISNDHPAGRVSGSTDSTTVQTYLDWENISSCATSASAMGLSGAAGLANSPASLLTKSGMTPGSNADLAYTYSAIVVQVTYRYQNVVGFFLGNLITLSATAVARPRSNVTIPCVNSSGASCPSLQ